MHSTPMRLRTRFQLLGRILKWRLTWGRCDPIDGIPVPGNPTFMSPDQAAALIGDGSVLMMSGIGGNARVGGQGRGQEHARAEALQRPHG